VALGVALTHELARHAGEALVVLALDPRHSLVVDVDTTDDRTRELAGGLAPMTGSTGFWKNSRFAGSAPFST
jgi:hypothetical protein